MSMALLDYLKTFPDERRRARFAARCGTTLGYMKQIAYGNKRCGEKIAIAIERESRGAVLVETMRPDVDWRYIRGTRLAAHP